ncbi:aldo/keto reductase [Clostridium sp. CX1]|uniref:aldo/keto reductase n=1 Tax=Clostridium sp. CX1 TaxID=2978346 RepID=UPI0021C13366|nr:aldo/keto reductase [Clostridium sp. CX1]MCT8977119.1 aldo/keto reductase [Clostridium sp. CX1]
MQYRKFGSCNIKPSALGFGCMRLPVLEEDNSNINEPEAIKLIRHAIDKGLTYIDTAYPYHGGNSELIVGKALKDGYREKVQLATKMPVWLVEKYEDFDKYLNEQLSKLQTDFIDFYLLHALDKSRIDKMEKLGVFNFLDKALKDGRIKHVGFSFHDKLDVFKHILDLYSWDFCQIQYNFLDEAYQAGKEGLLYAASKGLAVVIMEPLRGGTLAKTPPQEVEKFLKDSPINKSAVDWALSWIWNHPEVSVVLSGMNSIEQIDENIKIAEKSLPNSFTEKEVEIMDKVKNKFKELMKVGCTGCEYCMPCPAGVNIPRNFALYNQAFMYDDLEGCKNIYGVMPEQAKASCCISCGKCEDVCPQHLEIRKLLKDVAVTL